MDEAFESPWIRKVRMLTQALVISGALNIGLFSSLVYYATHEKSVDRVVKKGGVMLTETNASVLKDYFQLSMHGLISELRNDELLEEGCRRRDMALSCLVDFHFFDLERALPHAHLQKRQLFFVHKEGGERFDVSLFPGLREHDFASIIGFAKEEKWPLTPEGLYQRLKVAGESPEVGLKEAFFASNPFRTLFTRFYRIDPNVDRDILLALVMESGYEVIRDFTLKQEEAADFSKEAIVQFLTGCLKGGSSIASTFLIHLDPEFVLKRFDDEQLKQLIDQLAFFDSKSIYLLKQIICGVRGDGVRKSAALKLYAIHQQDPPNPYDHEVAVRRFLNIPCFEEDLKQPLFRTHVVKSGESLWKISKMYRCEIKEIAEANGMAPQAMVRVGQELKIPRVE
ncbi:MAG: hypothetical protein S4CHLAM102_04410 [Chlamydiia bacterium]|nr:hypothetical protein [Chlamydiia bacterium]